MTSIRQIPIALAITLLMTGCSLTYTDQNGYEHSFGLVHQEVRKTDGTVYWEKNTLGLDVNLSSTDGGTTLGYKKSIRVFVPEDSVLTIDRQDNDINASIEKFK